MSKYSICEPVAPTEVLIERIGFEGAGRTTKHIALAGRVIVNTSDGLTNIVITEWPSQKKYRGDEWLSRYFTCLAGIPEDTDEELSE